MYFLVFFYSHFLFVLLYDIHNKYIGSFHFLNQSFAETKALDLVTTESEVWSQ